MVRTTMKVRSTRLRTTFDLRVPASGLDSARGTRTRRWGILLALAGSLLASGAFAQIYKCTEADGRTAYSDKPCATAPGASGSPAGSKGGVKQESVRVPNAPAGNAGGDANAALCARQEGSKPSDAVIQSLPEPQRNAVTAALRGVVAGLARDPGAQEALKRMTLHVDASRTAIICVPRPRAQSPGAASASAYVVHRIEANGRVVTLQPGAEPLVYNDANEPQTVAARCASLITSCVRSRTSGLSLDECFEKQPVCPAGRLDPAASCCPQACKDAYRRERSAGTEPQTATIKVIFGDDAGAQSCVPGMPKR